MSTTNQGGTDPGISRAEFLREARKRLKTWIAALSAAVAPNFVGLVSRLREGTVDQGAVFGTLASVYLVAALGCYEARFVAGLVIREHLLAWSFRAFSRMMRLASALCCVLCWFLTDVQEPVEWEWHTGVAVGMLVLAVTAEGFLAAEYIRWGRKPGR